MRQRQSQTHRSVSLPVLPGVLLAASLLLPSFCQAAPSPDLRTQPVLSPQALSFQAQQDPVSVGVPSWFSEELSVHGKRHLHDLPPFEKPFMKRYDDGHAEGNIPIWKGIALHMQFGEDTKHDPVSGAYIAPFGEAYRLSNPLRQR